MQNDLKEARQQTPSTQDQSTEDTDLVVDLNKQIADLKNDLADAQSRLDDDSNRQELHRVEREKWAAELEQVQSELNLARRNNDSLRNMLKQQAESIAALKDDVPFQSHMDGEQLVELLEGKDRKVQLVEPNHLEITGESIASQLYIMANGDLLISSVFEDGQWTAEIVNEWNRERILSRAFLDDDEHVVLESELMAPDGLSDRAVLTFLENYDESLEKMRAFLKPRS